MQKAECPQCGKLVAVGSHPTMGKPIECEECGAELEVVWLDPLELDWRMFDDDEEFEEYEEEL